MTIEEKIQQAEQEPICTHIWHWGSVLLTIYLLSL